MKLTIVSGLSGSGKSVALHVLEDLGYHSIDNLPIGLLPAFAGQIIDTPDSGFDRFAVGIDARNLNKDLERFAQILETLRARGLACELFFLEANDATLLKRFSETRRKHPLTTETLSLEEAIEAERRLLEPLIHSADLVLDTSATNVHQLRDLIRERVSASARGALSLLFESFGYKHGLPVDADFVFDVRCIPNPHWEPELRALTGLSPAVVRYLESQGEVDAMYQDLCRFLDRWVPRFEADNRTYMTVAVGCTGGQHRSVYMVERLARHFGRQREHVLVRHRELS